MRGVRGGAGRGSILTGQEKDSRYQWVMVGRGEGVFCPTICSCITNREG